jgi:hypothetical protein
MLVGLILTLFSLASLFCWFRYSCGLILRAKPARDYAPEIAAANELQFPVVLENLPQANDRGVLKTLREKLEHDYALLSYLLHHSPAFHSGSEVFEQRMMMLNFELMKAYYAIASKRALREMTQVVCYLANRMGERAAWTPLAE